MNRIALAMVAAILFVAGATSPPTAAGIPPVPLSLPDLITSKFELLDRPKLINDDHVELAVAVGVKNQGTGQAGPFDVEIEYSYVVSVPSGDSTQGRRPGAERVLGYSIPFTAGSAGWGPLAPGQVAYHKGFLAFPATVRRVTVLLQAVADACHTGPAVSGIRDCRVKESNESNNRSARLSVSLP